MLIPNKETQGNMYGGPPQKYGSYPPVHNNMGYQAHHYDPYYQNNSMLVKNHSRNPNQHMPYLGPLSPYPPPQHTGHYPPSQPYPSYHQSQGHDAYSSYGSDYHYPPQAPEHDYNQGYYWDGYQYQDDPYYQEKEQGNNHQYYQQGYEYPYRGEPYQQKPDVNLKHSSEKSLQGPGGYSKDFNPSDHGYYEEQMYEYDDPYYQMPHDHGYGQQQYDHYHEVTDKSLTSTRNTDHLSLGPNKEKGEEKNDGKDVWESQNYFDLQSKSTPLTQ